MDYLNTHTHQTFSIMPLQWSVFCGCPLISTRAPSCRGLLVTMQFIAVPQALTRGSIRANEAWEEVRESEEGWSQRGSEWESMGSVGVARGKKRYITARRIKKNDTSSRPHTTEGRTNSSFLSYDLWHHHFFTGLPDSQCSLRGMMLICMRVHTDPLIVLSRLNCRSAKHANNLFAWRVSLSPPFVATVYMLREEYQK